ncbi:MAG: hypothetical protein EBQ76_06890 [Betaproteobacteria bacterium]|nr:hypothetical protein [Betaproteobacteria bacterium]NBY14442.1 hypothetical protein [Betaproteobacteria bacterium]NDF03743.1 hypothetical protein [Betaproteobacteria bacterium]
MSQPLLPSSPASLPADPQSAFDFAGLAELKAKGSRTDASQDKAAVRKAAEQFEAIFLQMMLKTMREASASNEEGDLMGSNATKTYEGLFDQEVARQMAKRGGLGLADTMVKAIERNQSGAPSSAEMLASRAKGLPLHLDQVPMTLRPEGADAGMKLPQDKARMPLQRDRLVVSTTTAGNKGQ